jgi:hypothetical protein
VENNEVDSMAAENAAMARRMWTLFESYHSSTYFTPESRAVTDELGCKGGWMGYFGMRAAPLGAASPELVRATFYNFHDSLVHRAIPDAWTVAPPARYLAARLAGVDGALRRMLGDMLFGDELAEAADLAKQAARKAQTGGRPLGAANAALPWPAEPHLALWQAATVLRESRGDGHVAALVVAGLDPCETLVVFAADTGLDPAYLRAARGWSERAWQDARQRLTERGLLAEDGTLTEAGRRLRATVERQTDEQAAVPWLAIGPDRTARFTELITPIVLAVAEANDAMRLNPMALNLTEGRSPK